MSETAGTRFAVRGSRFRRLLVVHVLQLPAIALVLISPSPWAWWPAAIWGSGCAVIGTDSGWRWLNRILMAEAVVWLWLGFAA